MQPSWRSRLAAAVAACAVLASACGPVVDLRAGDPVEFVRQPQTSKLLAADGTVLAELHAEQDREDVALDDVAPDLVRAVVAIEDRRFFLHAGVDAPAIVRAAITNVGAGDVEQGGSTITQQYVKNTMTGSARTMDRKLREAALAYQLEQRYSKDEILERYLNTVYFGRGAYGVRAAAERFFGVAPAALTLPQAAQLAGQIASPSRFDPLEHPDAAAERRRLVLEAMVATGQIDRSTADEAATVELHVEPPAPEEVTAAPYVVAEAKRLLQHDPEGRFAEVLGATLDERVDALFTGGLRVHLTVDPAVQAQAEHAVAEVLTEPDDPAAAVVALDPRTGAIRALVGGRDYFGDDPQARFNLATQGRRQPGSAFKPIVLATALSRGVSLDRGFPGGACAELPAPLDDWDPCNYGETPYGPLTLREATVVSANTVYARLAVELGPTAIVQTARTLGLTGELPEVPSLALGTAAVSPLELAGAYAPLATLGRYHPPHLVARIETADGRVLYEHDDRSYQVLEEPVAYLVTQTLEDVVRRGTAVGARIDRPQAGKTGTAQDNADAWFVGYTPDLVASVWVGFPEGGIPMRPPRVREVVEGGRWPADIWARFARSVLEGVPATPFSQPDVDLVEVEVDGTRNCLPNPYTPPELIEVRPYLRGTEPTERCTEPTGPPIDDVPGVIGLPSEVAQRLLRDRGFVVDVRPIASRLYPPGIVTRQRPEAGGTTLAEDANAVVLWISTTSTGRVEVPELVGRSRAEAVALLEALGFVVDLRTGCGSGCPPGVRAGTVWAQEPAPGASVARHTLVTVWLVPTSSVSGRG